MQKLSVKHEPHCKTFIDHEIVHCFPSTKLRFWSTFSVQAINRLLNHFVLNNRKTMWMQWRISTNTVTRLRHKNGAARLLGRPDDRRSLSKRCGPMGSQFSKRRSQVTVIFTWVILMMTTFQLLGPLSFRWFFIFHLSKCQLLSYFFKSVGDIF